MSAVSSVSSSPLSSSSTNDAHTDWHSIYVSTLVAFIGAIHSSSVMVWPYLQLIDPGASETFYGVLRSVSGLGTVLAAVAAGYTSNRTANTRASMMAGKLLALLSCSLYLCIELSSSVPLLLHVLFLLFELFLGASVGAASMYRTHVAHASTEQDRAKAVGVVNLAPAVGLIVGPIVNLVFSTIPFPGVSLLFGVHLNLFTAPILLAMLISAIALYLLLFHFDGTMHIREENNEEKCADEEDQHAFDWVAVAVCLVSRAAVSLSLINLITIGPPYLQMVFRWTSTEMVRYSSYILGSIGLIGIGWNLAYVFLDMRKRLSERNAILGSLALLLAVYLATFNWPFLGETIPYQQQVNASNASTQSPPVSAVTEAPLGCPPRFEWCASTTLVSMPVFLGSMVLALGIAIPVSQINLDILYSKVLGRIRQGMMQGWFIVCGDGLTLVFPILLGKVYELRGPVPIWVALCACLGACLCLWALAHRRMVPKSEMVRRRRAHKAPAPHQLNTFPSSACS